jgi:TetR/AcrR family fatty acid metabolism transcriptional regulator
MVSEMTGRFSKDEVVEEFRTQTILEAALRVIARKGREGATMLEIAREAGIAKGTIYLYFRNRETLLDRVSEFVQDGLLKELDQILGEPLPFQERLRLLVRTKFAFLAKNIEFFRVYLAIRLPEGEAHCPGKIDHEAYLQRLASFFRGAMEKGEIRTMDPSRLALFFAEGVTGILFQRISEPGSDPGDDPDLVVDLLLRGLQKEGE